MASAKTGASRYPGVRWRETTRGKVYEARWRDAAGKSHGKSGFLTAKEAADHLHTERERMRLGGDGNPAGARTKWSQVASGWLESRRSKGCKPRTLEGYERILRQHFGVWDNRPIGKLTPSDVGELLGRLDRAGLNTQTRHNVFNVASSVFDYAARNQLIMRNPARPMREDLPSRAESLRAAKDRVQFLSPTQVNRLADAVREASLDADKRRGVKPTERRADADALLVRFAAWSGLRRGELAALRLRHLDPLRSEVRVDESVSKVAGELLMGTAKTTRSRRSVPLPPALVAEVLRHAQADGLRPEDFLWGHSGKPRDMANFYRRRFQPASKRAGLPGVRMHDLRHTFASLMAHHGHKAQEVSAWMGHSSVSFTLDVYTHLFRDDEADARRSAALDAAYLAASGTAPATVVDLGR